jgi:hypothetical protein
VGLEGAPFGAKLGQLMPLGWRMGFLCKYLVQQTPQTQVIEAKAMNLGWQTQRERPRDDGEETILGCICR